MQIDKKTIRYLFVGGIGCIIVYWLLHETERFASLWSAVTGMLSPFVIGAVLAFIFNVPMRAIERKLKFIKKDGFRRTIAILLTFLFIILVVVGIFRLLVPQITETIQVLVPKLITFFQNIASKLVGYLEEHPEVRQWLTTTFNANLDLMNIDWAGLAQKILNMLSSSVTLIATGAFSAVGSITGGIVDAVVAIVFALYALGRKEILARQGRRIIYSILPELFCDETVRILRLTNSTFSNFISGQCLEACILGCLFAVAMALFKMPFIPLVSVLIAVTALIPVVGAFVGCILGAFFILVNDPLQSLVFVAMFLVLQQIEGNLIYPKVVGTSIGLPGMWVLVAVSVGGEIMGVAGMFVMIPVAAVLYTLAREFTLKRVAQRNIAPEKLMDQPPELKSKFKENRERKKRQKLRRQMQSIAQRCVHASEEKKDN
ncbi:MAG: AI-2E family transporter [Oscillospiraceae bacterium]|nr:AI-2E family transporter [Oscillospiraceae bacterium]